MITDEELAAMQARADAATPVPWSHDADETPAQMANYAECEECGREFMPHAPTYDRMFCSRVCAKGGDV